MAAVFDNVLVSAYREDDTIHRKSTDPHTVELSKQGTDIELKAIYDKQVTACIMISPDTDVCRLGKQSAVVTDDQTSTLLRFPSIHELKSFQHKLKEMLSDAKSVFRSRTDDASAVQYFQFYGYLSQQQNMMQDYIRTSTYQRAMLANVPDFHDKVVLDVGAGSGILSFFAIQAGAKRVYAVEASSMAQHCERLVRDNKLLGRIIVIPGKVEEVAIPEKVDAIISEPMGYMLFNERMLESFLHAKKWLKPNGKMFPTLGDLHIAPFTDEGLYMEQCSKANFWYQQSFHGVDLTILRDEAEKEYFKQPIVDTFDIRICMAKSVKYTVDFQNAEETDLHVMDIPVTFAMQQSGLVHGLAFWFDVAFLGSRENVWLSTVPTEPLTHWYQVRCLLQTPILIKYGQTLTGNVTLRCNNRQSYDVDIEMNVPGTSAKSCNTLDLKNPFFRYTGQVPSAPPGTANQSPTDVYWNTGGTSGQGQGHSIDLSVMGPGGCVNGGVNGDQENHMGGHLQNVVHTNLIPLSSAPINPGSIPSVKTTQNSSITNRTSVGAGISPVHFNSTQSVIYGGTTHFPVSNQFMIGDYVMSSGSVMTSGQYKQDSEGV